MKWQIPNMPRLNFARLYGRKFSHSAFASHSSPLESRRHWIICIHCFSLFHYAREDELELFGADPATA